MAAVTAIAMGLAAGVVWAAAAPTTGAVKLEAHFTPGDSPFMQPVGDDNPSITPPRGAAGTFTGSTPGLFADDADKPSCDLGSLVSTLQSDPARAQAWAQALNLRPEDIPGYAQTLSPVLLRADTAVTAHGYRASSYMSYPAVLQAGTAVFVNSFGEPTVKCFSGNPLTRPGNYAQLDHTGSRWTSFAPGKYTYVQPTAAVINVYKYYDADRHVIREERNLCADRPETPGCQAPNPDRHCENGDQPGCDGTTILRPDPAKEEAVKKAAADTNAAEATARATTEAKIRAAQALDLASKERDRLERVAKDVDEAATKAMSDAGELKNQAYRLPEPSRSQKLQEADQATSRALTLRNEADKAKGLSLSAAERLKPAMGDVVRADAADAKAQDDLKKAQDAAEKARVDADKAAGRDVEKEAAARKAASDAATADTAARTAEANLQGLEGQAMTLQQQADQAQEPLKSQLKQQADQARAAAEGARADAAGKAEAAKKAAADAAKAKTDADKAATAGTTTGVGGTTTGRPSNGSATTGDPGATSSGATGGATSGGTTGAPATSSGTPTSGGTGTTAAPTTGGTTATPPTGGTSGETTTGAPTTGQSGPTTTTTGAPTTGASSTGEGSPFDAAEAPPTNPGSGGEGSGSGDGRGGEGFGEGDGPGGGEKSGGDNAGAGEEKEKDGG